MRHTKKTKALERVHKVFEEHLNHTVTWRSGAEKNSGVLERVSTDYEAHSVSLWIRAPGEKFPQTIFSDQAYKCSCEKENRPCV